MTFFCLQGLLWGPQFYDDLLADYKLTNEDKEQILNVFNVVFAKSKNMIVQQ